MAAFWPGSVSTTLSPGSEVRKTAGAVAVVL
jgi:hypothetical protein